MTTLAWLKSALGTPAKTLQRPAREGGHPTVAGKLLRLLVEGLTDGEAESDHLTLGGYGGARYHAAAFPP